jgi:hypothetical protein
VGVRNAETGEYHLYVTNIPADYGLEEMPSCRRQMVETLLYTSVVTLLVSRRLLLVVREKLKGTQRNAPEERWGGIFREVSQAVPDVVLAPGKLALELSRNLEAMLIHEAVDSNRVRRPLIQRVENGVMW